MKLTSKEANKLLNKLNEEIISLKEKESRDSTFVAATTENKEEVRPTYNYIETKNKINDLEKKVIKLKHAINLFNTSTFIDELNMTIDEVLIYMSMLTYKKIRLGNMKLNSERERITSRNNSIIEYRYLNYDMKEIESDYNKVIEELNKVQSALDKANMTLTFEVDL